MNRNQTNKTPTFVQLLKTMNEIREEGERGNIEAPLKERAIVK